MVIANPFLIEIKTLGMQTPFFRPYRNHSLFVVWSIFLHLFLPVCYLEVVALEEIQEGVLLLMWEP